MSGNQPFPFHQAVRQRREDRHLNAVKFQQRLYRLRSSLPHLRPLRQQQVELEDLTSAGIIGLIQAVDRYQPERQCLLKTLVQHRIWGAMLDYLRQLGPIASFDSPFRPPARRSSARSRSTSPRRPPEETELADALGISLERYRKLDRIGRAAEVRSLDATPESALYRSTAIQH